MLTSKQKSHLKSMGSTMDSVLQIGKGGITPTVIDSARDALIKRELIKVRVLPNCLTEPEDAISEIADKTNADLVQVIGRNGLLFKRNADKPRIELP